MNAFFAGIVFGFLLAGSIAVIIATRVRRPKREPIKRTREFQEPALPVTTRITTKKREFVL